jgi:hypothetical protein
MKTKAFQKWMGIPLGAILLSCIFFACSSSNKAVKLNSGDIKNMVNSSQFIFVADRVLPLRGRTRILTSRYTVNVSKDTVDSYLPFFGRAFQAPMDPSKGGIQFVSTKFSYDVVPKKEDRWDVTIRPQDYSDVQQLFFTIFSNGSANLNVISTHKDAISFSGRIEKRKDQ